MRTYDLDVAGNQKEKTFPLETTNGVVWIKTKSVSKNADNTIVGYLQVIENPEKTNPKKVAPLRINNLLYQLNNISKILLSFLQAKDPDKIVNEILGDILKQFKAGRTYIFEYDWDEGTQTNTYEVVDENVKPEIDMLYKLPFEMTTWWTQQISQGKQIILSTLDDLPPAAKPEKDFLAMQDINSLFVAPLMSKEGVWGYAGVDIVDGFHDWTEEDCQWLSALVNIVSLCIQLQRSENRAHRDKSYLESLYRNMPLGYMRLQVLCKTKQDYDFIYLDVNDAAEKLFQQPLGNCLGKKASATINCFGDDAYQLQKQFESDTHLDLEYYIKWSDKYARLIAYSIHKDEVICLFADITESYHNQQRLIDAKEKAEISDRLKTAFLANMSHEIRTPLNAIVGFSDLLTHSEEIEKEDRSTYARIVQENNDLLLQVISDILDISKIEAGTIDLVYENIDAAQLCSELLQFYHTKTYNRKVKILICETVPSCIIKTDKVRLTQVLSNFVDNALKFTFEGNVSIGCQKVDDNTIKFYVKDTGTGIPKEKQEQIFNRFTKLDSFSVGTGLGLTISKSLVELMGGEIGVDSEVGQGSCFWFTYPLEKVLSPSW
nr:GAF domain-containing protein [Bacteroides sp. 519]